MVSSQPSPSSPPVRTPSWSMPVPCVCICSRQHFPSSSQPGQLQIKSALIWTLTPALSRLQSYLTCVGFSTRRRLTLLWGAWLRILSWRVWSSSSPTQRPGKNISWPWLELSWCVCGIIVDKFVGGNFRLVKFLLSGLESVFSWSYFFVVCPEHVIIVAYCLDFAG